MLVPATEFLSRIAKLSDSPSKYLRELHQLFEKDRKTRGKVLSNLASHKKLSTDRPFECLSVTHLKFIRKDMLI